MGPLRSFAIHKPSLPPLTYTQQLDSLMYSCLLAFLLVTDAQDPLPQTTVVLAHNPRSHVSVTLLPPASCCFYHAWLPVLGHSLPTIATPNMMHTWLCPHPLTDASLLLSECLLSKWMEEDRGQPI